MPDKTPACEPQHVFCFSGSDSDPDWDGPRLCVYDPEDAAEGECKLRDHFTAKTCPHGEICTHAVAWEKAHRLVADGRTLTKEIDRE